MLFFNALPLFCLKIFILYLTVLEFKPSKKFKMYYFKTVLLRSLWSPFTSSNFLNDLAFSYNNFVCWTFTKLSWRLPIKNIGHLILEITFFGFNFLILKSVISFFQTFSSICSWILSMTVSIKKLGRKGMYSSLS